MREQLRKKGCFDHIPKWDVSGAFGPIRAICDPVFMQRRWRRWCRRVLQGVILHTATRGSFIKSSCLRQLFAVSASSRVDVGSNKRNRPKRTIWHPPSIFAPLLLTSWSLLSAERRRWETSQKVSRLNCNITRPRSARAYGSTCDVSVAVSLGLKQRGRCSNCSSEINIICTNSPIRGCVFSIFGASAEDCLDLRGNSTVVYQAASS